MSTGIREKGRKTENFHMWLKLCWGELCLLLGSPEPPSPDTAHSPPQADPGLNTLWRLGSLYSLCICRSGENLQPRPWMLNSVPGCGVPGGECLPS